jgi:hypothetical protein
VALKSDAAAEKSKDRLREIFRVVLFSTFATISAKSRLAVRDYLSSLAPEKQTPDYNVSSYVLY